MSESYWAAWLFTRHETELTGAEDTWDVGRGPWPGLMINILELPVLAWQLWKLQLWLTRWLFCPLDWSPLDKFPCSLSWKTTKGSETLVRTQVITQIITEPPQQYAHQCPHQNIQYHSHHQPFQSPSPSSSQTPVTNPTTITIPITSHPPPSP